MNSYGFRLLTSGVDMEQYQRNPVLLYMHERGKVIGTVENIAVEGQDLVGELVFDEVTSKSKEVAAQWDKGSLRMVSAGLEIIETSDDQSLLLPGQTGPTDVLRFPWDSERKVQESVRSTRERMEEVRKRMSAAEQTISNVQMTNQYIPKEKQSKAQI